MPSLFSSCPAPGVGVIGWGETCCTIPLLKKNSGVIYVGIQYLVVFSGVTFTPVLGIQKNIISCVVRA